MLTEYMSPIEAEKAARYAMSGGRGYGGDCYAGRVVPDQRSDDARGVLMESARALGILGEQQTHRQQDCVLWTPAQSQIFGRVAGSKACRLQMSTLVVQIARLLTPLVNEADKGALLPSRHVSLVAAVCGVVRKAGSL